MCALFCLHSEGCGVLALKPRDADRARTGPTGGSNLWATPKNRPLGFIFRRELFLRDHQLWRMRATPLKVCLLRLALGLSRQVADPETLDGFQFRLQCLRLQTRVWRRCNVSALVIGCLFLGSNSTPETVAIACGTKPRVVVRWKGLQTRSMKVKCWGI